MRALRVVSLLLAVLLAFAGSCRAMVLRGGVTHTDVQGQLSDSDAATLSSYDLLVFIDKSGSMADKDCRAASGEKISRWEWCREQTASLTGQLSRIPAANIVLIPFNKEFRTYEHVDLDQIGWIFDTNKPEGGTYLTEAMQPQLEAYFQRKAMYGNKTRPLMLVVVTDGAPKNPGTVEQMIADASNRINNPRELSIVFIQIGHDSRGISMLSSIHDELARHGARLDIVKTRMFDSVQQYGLARTLVQAASGRPVYETLPGDATLIGDPAHEPRGG